MTLFDRNYFEKHKFKRAGFWKLSERRIGFEGDEDFKDDDQGYVYIWVAENNDRRELLYVGKAGGAVSQRCEQHVRGFVQSGTGKKHDKRLRKRLRAMDALIVYARKSPRETILEQKISMCSAEEVALIARFDPPWNKESRRASARRASE